MAILVTGGAGYIGSHTCVELQNAGYDVVVLDNLSNSSEKSLDRVKAITGKDVKFYKGDATANAYEIRFTWVLQAREKMKKTKLSIKLSEKVL